MVLLPCFTLPGSLCRAEASKLLKHDGFESKKEQDCSAGRVMKAGGVRGSIINLGSISGMRGCSYEDVPYQVSKATIIAATRTAAAKLVLDGIRVNCISPSMTRTVRRPLGCGRIIPTERTSSETSRMTRLVDAATPPAAVQLCHRC